MGGADFLRPRLADSVAPRRQNGPLPADEPASSSGAGFSVPSDDRQPWSTAPAERDILGLWAGDGGEGAKFWLHVLTEIKNRGVAYVLMMVCDGLKGLPQAARGVLRGPRDRSKGDGGSSEERLDHGQAGRGLHRQPTRRGGRLDAGRAGPLRVSPPCTP